jgi:hypothetical protein
MLQERCFQVQTELILVYPAEIIINYAEENRPEIVMGWAASDLEPTEELSTSN